MLEFALAAGVIIPCLTGTFQFGYGLYTYNRLQSAVDDGGRFAALRTYRCKTSADVTKVKLAIQNMVAYGTPSPGNNPVQLISGLAPGNVNVTYTLSGAGVPSEVRVNISNYSIQTIFSSYAVAGKPVVTFPFVGRYAPEESEP